MMRVGGGRHSALGLWRFTNTTCTSPEGSAYRFLCQVICNMLLQSLVRAGAKLLE